MRTIATTLSLTTAALLAAACNHSEAHVTTHPSSATLSPTRSGRAPVNGVDYYYEVYGHGEPLLLLHGGLGSIEMFAPLLPQLADHHEVIAVDLQGHGRTPLGERAIDLADEGRDLGGLLDQL